ncbi:uncharacterized protein LOC111915688 [Lactuca sativa]|uniref:uncharacterized protein LOC111915688 n=1 Tax=Lactuca sativa TaxID=4236 RepID=UPI000CB3E5BD|nr:uncharacterized protein LOC111915688 [Lactuca sativa]
MATSLSTLLPESQQPQEQEPIAQGDVHSSSGSIGPFFAVMSVLMVLTILSCVFGRIYGRQAAEAPLDKVIKSRDCFGWLKGRLSHCMVGCGGAGGGHVITLAGKGESRKAEEGVV